MQGVRVHHRMAAKLHARLPAHACTCLCAPVRLGAGITTMPCTSQLKTRTTVCLGSTFRVTRSRMAVAGPLTTLR